ncbi:MAG: G1 family endopeptidase [Sulfobacillus thermotolerans]|nr:G1 family endopeptidase [Sulfobacillus thermotolerans]
MNGRRLVRQVVAAMALCGVEALLLYGHNHLGSLVLTGSAAPGVSQQAQDVKYAPVTKLASVQSSQNWAGYVVSSGQYRSVSATWTVPAIQNGSGVAAQWVGLGGVKSQDLLQTGTIEQQNSNGAVTAQVFVEELPQHAQDIMTVPIGSTISASIEPVSSDQWDLTITAVHQGQTQTKTVPMTVSAAYAAGMETSAEWIFEDPANTTGNLYPLATTKKVTFSKVQANNQAVTSANALVMTGPGGQPEVEPSVMKNGAFSTKEVSGGAVFPSPSQGFPFSEFPQGIGLGNGGGLGDGYGMGNGFGGFGWQGPGYGVGYGPQGFWFPSTPVIIQVPSITIQRMPLPFSLNL